MNLSSEMKAAVRQVLCMDKPLLSRSFPSFLLPKEVQECCKLLRWVPTIIYPTKHYRHAITMRHCAQKFKVGEKELKGVIRGLRVMKKMGKDLEEVLG